MMSKWFISKAWQFPVSIANQFGVERRARHKDADLSVAHSYERSLRNPIPNSNGSPPNPEHHFWSLIKTASFSKILQISLMQVSTAICFVLLNSTLNRVLIVEFNVSAVIVGVLIGFHNLFAFIRPFVGFYSDTHRFWGLKRTPLILMGNLFVVSGTLMSVYGAVMMNTHFIAGITLLLLSFSLYGIGINITGTMFYALLADNAGEKHKSKAVTIGWFILILGSILASVVVANLLVDFSEAQLIKVFWIGAAAAIAFTWVAMFKSESPDAEEIKAPIPVKTESRKSAMKKLIANRPVYHFFIFMFVTVLAIQAQDVILEPFGAHLFGMTVSETAKLTQVWGGGTLIGLVVLGLFFVSRMGAKRTTYLGCAVSAAGFLMISISPSYSVDFFKAGIFLLGLGNGALTVGSLTMMMNMTTAQNAGFFMGLWGMAQAAANFLANTFGGAIRDIALYITGDQYIGYSTAFSLEVIALIAAVWILSGISIEEFKKKTSTVLTEVVSIAD